MLVTHDADLASHAQRQIILRDGLIVSDEINRRDAETPTGDFELVESGANVN